MNPENKHTPDQSWNPDDKRIPEVDQTIVLREWTVDGKRRQRVRFLATPAGEDEPEIMEDTYEEIRPRVWQKVPGEMELDLGPAPESSG